MSKFTKGEWRCCDGTQFGEQVLFVDVKDKESVVCRLTKQVNKDIPLSYEDIANAHLIAAAPDMYEALEGMIDMYTALINSGDCGNWDPEEDKEVIAARKSITKARGD